MCNIVTSRPVQRLMRYHILLMELQKMTPIKHHDYKYIVKADKKFHELVDATNTRAKQCDQALSCATSFSDASEFIQPWRYCLCYGECYINTVKEKYMCFVFNDVLLWMNSCIGLTKGTKMTYYFNVGEEKTVYLKDITEYEKSSHYTNSCKIVTNTKTWIFIFCDVECYNIVSKLLSQTQAPTVGSTTKNKSKA